MKRVIKININRFFRFRNISLLVIGIVSMIAYSLVKENEYSFLNPLEYYSFMVGAFLPILFPIIIIIICDLQFSNEIKNRFLVYERFREGDSDFVVSKLVSNIIIVFTVMFIVIFTPFIFAFYIEPLFNLIIYEPENLYNMTTQENQITSFTYSQLMQVHPLFFAVVYSAWVGLNGSLYSVLGFLCLLILENRFVALSIPFLVYQLGSFVIAILGVPTFLLNSTIFPFNIEQHAIWTTFVPFTFIFTICIILSIYIKKNKYELNSLQ